MYPNDTTNKIPYGYCHCGCGEKTNIANMTRPQHGWIKGEPLRYILGHQWAGRRKQIELANPSGLCMCGCGQETSIAIASNTRLGHIMGQPKPFIHGHNGRKFARPEPPNPSGFCMCGCGMPTSIAKETDGRAGIAKGQHYKYYGGHYATRPIEERFWEKIDKNGPIHPILKTECWLWTGATNPAGYGLIHDETDTLAHRVAFKLTKGPITPGMLICHECDNPPCCNPAHLFEGTHADNMQDMYSKGRKPFVNYARGEKSGSNKLTSNQVIEIRIRYAQGEKQTHLAHEFGVTQSAVWAIIRRKCWKHI